LERSAQSIDAPRRQHVEIVVAKRTCVIVFNGTQPFSATLTCGFRQEGQLANNNDPNQKQPGEKSPGTFHYNPGNMSGKKAKVVHIRDQEDEPGEQPDNTASNQRD
jgi:hypothetical protein